MHRRKTEKGVKIGGVFAILLALGSLFYFAFGQQSMTVPNAEGEVDVIQPSQAKEYAATQVCLSECTRSHRTCKAVALDAAEKTACEDEHTECRDGCEGG